MTTVCRGAAAGRARSSGWGARTGGRPGIATETTPGPHEPPRHEERGARTSTWPPPGTRHGHQCGPLLATRGDFHDNAMAEAFKSLFKAECIRNPVMPPKGGWKSVGDLEPSNRASTNPGAVHSDALPVLRADERPWCRIWETLAE